jgi:streptogramin lyase
MAVVPAAAQAAPSSKIKNLGETPGYLATDAQGNAWVIIGGLNETVARVKPGGNVTKFNVPELDNAGDGARGQNGNMFFTVQNGVVEFDPSDPVGSATEHTINSITDARGITKGPAGRMYAASGDQLVSFETADPSNFKDETVNGMGARDIVASGGEIFAADFAGGRIVRATRQLDVTRRYGVGGGPQEMAAGPNGSVAFGNPGTVPQTVGRINATGPAKTTDLPNMTDPFGMAFMPDGKYWFAEFARHRMGTLSPGGKVQHKNGLIPDNSGPRYAAKAKGGVLYVGLEGADKIAIIKGIN